MSFLGDNRLLEISSKVSSISSISEPTSTTISFLASSLGYLIRESTMSVLLVFLKSEVILRRWTGLYMEGYIMLYLILTILEYQNGVFARRRINNELALTNFFVSHDD